MVNILLRVVSVTNTPDQPKICLGHTFMKLNLYLASIALTPQRTSRITHSGHHHHPNGSSPLPIMTIITIIIIKYTNQHHHYHHYHHRHHHYHHQSPSRFSGPLPPRRNLLGGKLSLQAGIHRLEFLNFNLFVILVMLSVEIGKSQDFTNLTRLKHLKTLS